MSLITLKNISLAYGIRPLMENIFFVIEKGERIALIGRNGEGKSSLLKVMDQTLIPDEGEVIFDSGIKISTLMQDVPRDLDQTVYDVVASGLEKAGEALSEYHQLLQAPQNDVTLKKLDQLQHTLEALDGWSLDQKVASIISQLDLPADKKISELSGGWIRRVLLGKALVSDPDLLLLDEPTNHLDIDAIIWLEDKLKNNFFGAVLFITHDRLFLQSLATKIIELDRGQLSQFPGDYLNYQRRKEEMLHSEAQERALFDKRLAEEEIWIRKGIQARRTRNEGRVRALKAMRQQYQERINQQGIAKIHIEEGQTSGKKVTDAKNISYDIDGKVIIQDFSLTLMRGDRIGLIGPNGIGKSTLLKILFKQLEPKSGDVELGTKLEIAYFDQLRAQLDLEKTVIDNVAEGSDFIEINGKKFHLIGWLQDFMFTPEKARSPVKALSGGERNRLLLAKLFAKPANIIVLDEPTNDLDIETLEVLEELLLNFEGTLIIVSHDRAFLDRTVTSTLVFEGDGRIGHYVGGYSDWLQSDSGKRYFEQLRNKKNSVPRANEARGDKSDDVVKVQGKKPEKLSYKEQRDLETLPLEVEKLEKKINQLTEETQNPEFYKSEFAHQQKILDEITALNEQLEVAFERWELLEEKNNLLKN